MPSSRSLLDLKATNDDDDENNKNGHDNINISIHNDRREMNETHPPSSSSNVALFQRRRWFDVMTSAASRAQQRLRSVAAASSHHPHTALPQQEDEQEHHHHQDDCGKEEEEDHHSTSTCSSTCSPKSSRHEDEEEEELDLEVGASSPKAQRGLLLLPKEGSFDSSSASSLDTVHVNVVADDVEEKAVGSSVRHHLLLKQKHSILSVSSATATACCSQEGEPKKARNFNNEMNSHLSAPSSSKAKMMMMKKKSKSTLSSSQEQQQPQEPTSPDDDDEENDGAFHVPRVAKLLFGAVGIYTAYLLYGNVQEDLFTYKSTTSSSSSSNDSNSDTVEPETFQSVWLLQTVESFVNVVVGAAGRRLFGGRDDLHVTSFLACGVSQLFAKGFTSMALAAGLSFPVAILCKSAKIVPVMLGQLILGRSRYQLRDYIFCALVVSGTALLTAGSKKSDHSSSSTPAGLLCIAISLVADGFTGGLQKRLLRQHEDANRRPTPFDFMMYTNLAMTVLAALLSVSTHDFSTGVRFLQDNPAVVHMVVTCCLCSALGQSFIFYVVATFDPYVCATITTTRKILSVLWSVFSKGHLLSSTGNVGLSLALAGLLVEVQGKAGRTCSRTNNDYTAMTTSDESEDHDDEQRHDTNDDDDAQSSIHRSSTASLSSHGDEESSLMTPSEEEEDERNLNTGNQSSWHGSSSNAAIPPSQDEDESKEEELPIINVY